MDILVIVKRNASRRAEQIQRRWGLSYRAMSRYAGYPSRTLSDFLAPWRFNERLNVRKLEEIGQILDIPPAALLDPKMQIARYEKPRYI